MTNNKFFEILFLMMGISICTFINLICNNLFEWDEDETNSENSFGQKVGILHSERLLKLFYLISFSGYIGSLFFNDFFIKEFSLSLSFISVIHLLIYKYQNLPFKKIQTKYVGMEFCHTKSNLFIVIKKVRNCCGLLVFRNIKITIFLQGILKLFVKVIAPPHLPSIQHTLRLR